jgi:lipoprotein-releasing system permease protein
MTLICFQKEKRSELNFSLYIAKRYLFSKSRNNAINIITLIAAAGVVLGAMSLFIVLSGFSGLKDFSLQFTNVFDSDLKIYPAQGKLFTMGPEQEQALNDIESLIAYSRVIEERVFLHYRGKNHIAYIKGVDQNYGKVNPVDSILFLSEWFEAGQSEVVIGLGTSSKLSLGVMDYNDLLEIYVPRPGTGQILDPSKAFVKKEAIVSGMYQVNEELDSKYVFSDIDFARSLLRIDSTKISSIEFKLSPDTDEEVIRNRLKSIFSDSIMIKNRIQQNDVLYKMLNTENIAVYLIFTLVLIIALFNVVGSIIMMILDKRSNLITLSNLGVKIGDIRRIFFLQGTLMAVLGGLLGIILGIIAVWLQMKYEFVKITYSLPYPVKLKLINIIVVFLTISLLGMLASKIASGRVKKKLLQ